MTLYAVGDLQGCLEPLERLLDHVNFDPSEDILWLTGDLINRGPDSIGCLQFVRRMGKQAITVLGNHDLHVIALHELDLKTKDADIKNTLSHSEAPELLKWLRKQPLLVRDRKRKLIMTHAGIPPVWSDKKARNLAKEVEAVLRHKGQRRAFFNAMYGNEPNTWEDGLTGHDRHRYIVNAFTRMRFCKANGELDFKFKSSPKQAPKNMHPWFTWPVKRKHRLVFGHWAALMGFTHQTDMIGLDTGYVWGNHLTLMNLDNDIRYCCDTTGDITEYDRLEFSCLKLEEA